MSITPVNTSAGGSDNHWKIMTVWPVGSAKRGSVTPLINYGGESRRSRNLMENFQEWKIFNNSRKSSTLFRFTFHFSPRVICKNTSFHHPVAFNYFLFSSWLPRLFFLPEEKPQMTRLELYFRLLPTHKFSSHRHESCILNVLLCFSLHISSISSSCPPTPSLHSKLMSDFNKRALRWADI